MVPSLNIDFTGDYFVLTKLHQYRLLSTVTFTENGDLFEGKEGGVLRLVTLGSTSCLRQ